MNSPTIAGNRLLQSRHILRIVTAVACLALHAFSTPTQAQEKGIESLRKTGKAFASVAKEVSPAVVFIRVEKRVENQQAIQFFSPFDGKGSPFGDEFFRRFFGMPSPQGQSRQFRQGPRQEKRVVGQGSGFIISTEGYILTNNHVVGDADQVTVTLQDGREFEAKTIGTDPHSDVAVIDIDAENLSILPLGDSDALEVGEWVIAVGNPFGLSHTLTAGIVSAKGRSSVGIADYENFIQTDAAINPGNSGGPLVNLDGKAVGMNTAIFSRSGGYMGIGFAIPINMAKAIGDQLIEHGAVTRGFLGIIIQDLTPDLARTFDLESTKGILVSQVNEDTPAEKAGLKRGDVIVAFDGKPVGKVASFRNRVSLTNPGTRKKIAVLRDGQRKTFTVTICKLPDGDVAAGSSSHSLDELGLTVQTLTRDLAEQFGVQGENGVLVTQVKPGSVAAAAGFHPGVVIQEVNRKRIENVDEFRQAVERTPDHGTLLMLIKDGEYSRYMALRMKK